MKNLKKLGVVLAAAALLAVGCADSNNGDTANNFNNVNSVGGPVGGPVNGANGQIAANFVQVEQLARPGIAEVLLVTQKSLATYNAVGPAFIAAALNNSTSPEGVAANSTLTEAIGLLTAYVSLAPAGPAKPTVAGLVGAFLPDVLRIDTTVAGLTAVNGTEKSAFAAAVNAKGSPCAGRKLTDDVVDIALTVLTGGGVTSDNVPYYRPAAGAGSTNLNIGHQRLNGQTANFGPSTFPFLAPAN